MLILLQSCAFLFVIASTAAAQSTRSASSALEPLPVDKLLAIASVVGSETPQWMPDGTILITSSLAGGGLITISPDNGLVRRIPVQMGGRAHFLVPQSPQVSPDGNWISYVSNKSGSPELWLWSFRDGRDRRLTDLGSVGINSYSWSPDSRHIAFASNRQGDFDIFTVEIASGRSARVTSDPRHEVYPSWTPEGTIMYVRLDERWMDHDVLEMAADGSRTRLVVSDENFFDYGIGSTFGYPMVSPNGRQVMFRSHRSGWINYWVVDRNGGEPRQIAAEAADQSHARWSPDGRQIAFVSNQNGTLRLKVVPSGGGTPRTLVDPGVGVVGSPEWSRDGQQISYLLSTPTRPSDLFVVSVRSGTSAQLTSSMPTGNLETTLIRPEKISYRSTNGLEIPAYLYRPANMRPGEQVPAIVWAHGGPTSQYDDSFQQHVQYFVQRGYAALLPNFRGSSGYGREFEDLNFQCWGHCDLEDIVAGAEYLRTLPWVDGRRLGITGTSYGAFMTCAAATFAPEVFQAGIAHAGYCNRVAFLEDGEFRHLQQLAYKFGDPQEFPEVYHRNSPFFFIENIRMPLFLIHGVGRFPESPQFRHFADRMQMLYKPVQYKTYPNENYYVYGRENRKEMLGDMLEFFDRHLQQR